MRRTTACLFVLLVSVAEAQAQEAESVITRVGLFKNGVGLVERTIAIPNDGTFHVAPAPSPLHGTVWMRSEAEIGARLVERTIELEIGRGGRAASRTSSGGVFAR